MTKPSNARNRKLIKRSFQLRLVGACMGVTTLALLLQFLLLSFFVTKRAGELGQAGGVLADQLPGMLILVLGLTLAVILPVVIMVGIQVTFRFAGPIHHIEQYMLARGRGEKRGQLKLRKGDELQFLADAINVGLEGEQETDEFERAA